MPKHKHKPGMVMVISIGAKPKKKGETGVKKGQIIPTQPEGEGCVWVMNTGRRCGSTIVARGPRLCENHARIIESLNDERHGRENWG